MYFGADYQFNVPYDTPISLDQNAVDQGFSFMGDIFDQGTSEAGAAWSSLIEHINNMSTLEKGSAVFGAMQFAFTKVLANTPLGAPAAIGAFAGKVSVLSEAISEGNVKPSDVINVASGILGLISSFAALATLGIAGTAAAVGATTVATTFGGAAIIVAGIGFLLDRYGDELASYVGDGWNSFKDFMSGALGDIADALSSIGDAVSQGFDDLISQLSDLFDQARNTVSPLILDLDGDGVETLGINAGVHFDHDGNGFAETTGWVSKDDGLLVWDRNGNGRIDDGSELFGNYSTLANGQNAANGFAALADLDSNHDGKIDASDAAFNQLYVWRDSNSDATVAVGELLSLTEANVGSLNTAFTSQNQTDAQGNQVLQTGTYTDANGVTHSMNDIWFSVDTARTQDLSQIAISAEIAALPDMAGFGNVADLSQVMARDENGHLQTLVEQFASETDATVRQALLDQIVFVWSGAAGYSATSRGGYIDDGRKLYAVEAFLGQTFLQSAGTNAGTPNPGPNAAAQLMQAYDQLANFIYAGLMLQTHFKPLIESLDLSLAGNAIELDVTALVEQLRTLYNQDAELGTQTMAEFGRCLTDIGSTRGTEILASLRQAGDVNATGFSLVLASIGYTLGGSENDELYGDGGVNLLLGLSGRDTIYGDAGNDTLDGGAGNDYLSGDAGSDIYRFSRGWGQDTLNNFDSGIEKTDAIEFASNIASTDIVVTRSGDNLILSLKDTTDKITVSNYFNNDGTSPYKLDDIRFSDGTTWGINQVKVMVMVSTAGADELHGYATDDQLSGGLGNDSLYGADGDDELGGAAGNDRLEGGAGSDLYIFNLGDGQDVISENASNSTDIDVLRFGEGISPADIRVGSIGTSLVLSHSNGQDQVTILNWFYQTGTRYQLEKIEFADGTVWTGAQLTTSLLQQSGTEGDDVITGVSTNLIQVVNGGGGNDTLTAGSGDDRLEGGTGNDVLNGGRGSDLYLFNLGDGQDVINDDNSIYSDVDVLRFGAGILAADITASRSGINLVLNHANGQDKITLTNWFAESTGRYQLERIEFADGTVWTSAALSAQLLQFTGGAGDDVLTGVSVAFNQVFSGGGGNDTLTAGSGADRLEGGTGNDVLNGGRGSDLYLFNLGDGQDVINDDNSIYSGVDVLRFGAGILAADITASRSGINLVLSHVNGQDKITLTNWFAENTGRYQLERIEFADGTVWTSTALSAQLLQLTGGAGDDVLTGISSNQAQIIRGGGGNDTLTAGTGDDLFEGGTGNDVLNGGRGSDLYLFNLGDGQDVINDDNSIYSDVDVLRFGAGILAADITASRSGINLVLSHVNGQDKITLTNWFAENTGRYQLERIEFANGTVWTSATLSAQLLQFTGGAGDDVLTGVSVAFNQVFSGGGGNDTLTAGSGDDRLEGGTGNDVLNGGRGSDLYLFNLGDGQDVINDDNSIYRDVDVLRFGAGILAADITASRSGINLMLSHVNGQDKITLTNWFAENTGRYQLERIEFADGTVWTSAALSAQLLQFTGGAGDDVLTGVSVAFNQVFSGGGGNDTLTAGSGDDRLEGGTGNDVLNGGRGSDLYLFNLGDGQDVINDDNSIYSDVDVLRFGAGILAADITASRSGINLVLSHVNGQDKITLTNWFAENTGRYQLERIEFANGTVWTSATLSAPLLQLTGGAGDDVLTGISSNQAQIIRGGGGNDTLTAGTGDDLFEGGTGNDVLNGGRGSDLYLFNLGDGQDVINDDNSIYRDVDVLRFGAGILAADITASRSGINLVLNHANGQDKITLTNWFAENTGRYQLERIEFADGTVWTSAALSAQLLQFTGGAGDDVLTGVSVAFNQVFSGGGGNDTLTAGSGDDRLEGGTGNDVLNGGRGSDLYLFNLGDGQDVINDDNSIYSDVDVLRFGAGILAADITASRSGINLVLSHVNGQDKITLTNWFAENTGRYQLERIEFADGTVWTSAALSAQLLQFTGGAGDDVLTGVSVAFNQVFSGGGGNDTLTAGSGDDRLEGGTGNDVLNGGRGSDLYLFNLGDGQDVINDDNSIYSDVDVLRFGAGILAADITASRSGINLVLSHVNGQDKITLTNWFAENTGRYQLERIEFADGTVWTSAALSAQLLQFTGGAGDDVLTGVSVAFNQVFSGGGGNDTLTAGSGADRLEGGTGNDVLNGGRGSDLYLFNLGDGQDVINDDNSIYSGVDVLRFGAGILAADITASRSGINLMLSHVNGQDKITLTNWFAENTGRYQLERIEFADGTVWTSAALSAQLLQFTGGAGDDVLTGVSVAFNQVFSGGGGNDTLTAGSGADRLEGGTGNDVLNGGRGSDLYLFNLGDGQDVINDDNSIYSGVDVLRFGAGILAADITASRSGINLMLSHVNGQDKITLTNWFAENTGRYQLERIEFADGVIWSSSQVTSRTSTAGNDVIVGTSNNDRLQGGKGNDSLQGGDGSDTYVFTVGDGLDTINNLSSTPGDTDVLSIEGISNQNLWFSHENNNLVIDVTGSEDRITIQDWYNNTAQQIDVIQAGSTALYANAVDNLVNAMAAFGPPAGGEISLTQAQRDQVNVVIATNWQ
ncbi:calcium-binding protein [Pseudomonas chlororaphis]|uniref:calcium-binding protein n=1 Tax=Pseudomonas chlororaphis TaxID=587753 RepID=UPI00240831B8|nr:calcium-binding protein [Pseudomonas chlororaphis]